jgi:16S rRNA (uracil1498-N3)-methyltransferase
MRPPVFVAEPDQLAGDLIVLSGAEGRHAATVRRLGPGEHVDVTDGSGTVAECQVTRSRDGELELAVLARRAEPPPVPRLTVLQALPKGDRGELAVETMTEVGVDVIVPWAAERCVVQWRGDRGDRALARWRSAGLAAAKQARRARFPEITALAGRDGAARLVAAADLAILLDPAAETPLAGLAARAAGLSSGPAQAGPAQAGPAQAGGIVLITGPEGGVSPAETSLLTEAGAVPARLGPSVLRASTAGAVAAAIVLSDTGRWS